MQTRALNQGYKSNWKSKTFLRKFEEQLTESFRIRWDRQ